jgi:hypothetical protein
MLKGNLVELQMVCLNSNLNCNFKGTNMSISYKPVNQKYDFIWKMLKQKED